MKKRVMATIMVAVMLACITVGANAADTEITPQYAAERLNYYDLMQGTESGFELDRTPTRLEMLVMIIRLMGAEHALESNISGWTHPFTDVPDWGEKYVIYGYNTGITGGISAKEFGADLPATEAQFITIVLRALGYDDSYGIYAWDTPWWVSSRIGLTGGNDQDHDVFTRGKMAVIAYKALGAFVNTANLTLYERSVKYGSIGNLDQKNEGYQEFGGIDNDIVIIPIIDGLPAMEGYGELKWFSNRDLAVRLWYGNADGGLTIFSTNCEIANITADESGMYEDDGNGSYYLSEMTVSLFKPGKTAIVAFSNDGFFQALQIEVIDLP